MPKYIKVLLLVLQASVFASCATQNCDLERIYARDAKSCGEAICPPAAPQEGPGSGQSPHASFETFEVGDGFFDPYRSVVYVPASPYPKSAAVVLFLHGYFDARPKPYDAMLRHYARKGYIVVYPSYGNALDPKAWADNAEEAMKRAVTFLASKSPVKADLNRVAYVGHSIGGILALHLAERETSAAEPVIPRPKLIVAMDAAGITSPAYPYLRIDELSAIPKETKILILMAEETYMKRLEDPAHCIGNERDPPQYCNGFAVNRLAFLKTPQIPAEQKMALVIASDMRGELGLRSEHNGAQGYCGWFGGKPIDAIDTWGYWKYTVAAFDQALAENPADLAFLRSDKIQGAGTWSDGRPAKAALPIDACLNGGNCPAPQ